MALRCAWVMRGINTPLLVEVISNIADECGGVLVSLMATPCENPETLKIENRIPVVMFRKKLILIGLFPGIIMITALRIKLINAFRAVVFFLPVA
jgi:hypothetical protein